MRGLGTFPGFDGIDPHRCQNGLDHAGRISLGAQVPCDEIAVRAAEVAQPINASVRRVLAWANRVPVPWLGNDLEAAIPRQKLGRIMAKQRRTWSIWTGKRSSSRNGNGCCQNLESLSTDELKKKKKFASLILGIWAGVVLAPIIVPILKGGGLAAPLGIAALLFVTGLAMFIGEVKGINEELERRENS